MKDGDAGGEREWKGERVGGRGGGGLRALESLEVTAPHVCGTGIYLAPLQM